MMNLLAITPSENSIIEIKNLMTIGGEKSSGFKLKGLKHKDDYIVVSCGDDKISLIPLRGSKRAQVEIGLLEKFQMGELTLVAIPAEEKQLTTVKQDDSFLEVFAAFKEISSELKEGDIYNIVLKYLLRICGFDRGLIIARNVDDHFEVVSHVGADPSAPWLSESFLKQTLSNTEPVFISNLIGSAYEKNHSLMATGFLSVAAWPLTWNGKVVGTLLGGSGMPHQAPSDEAQRAIQILGAFSAQNVANHIQRRKLERNLKHRTLIHNENPFTTDSRELIEVVQLAKKIAPSDLSVHILGETGTGKEVLANWIHNKAFSGRAPFIPVNCGALPENLVESILFGHKKGSFTGATSDQTGKFVMAHGGTLFLDEIGDLPLHVQGKLLRALQEKQIEPIGANKPMSINVRVVCASHKNLLQMVEEGKFREDLYFRLAEVTLAIPPLRDRPEDITLLAHEFIQKECPDKVIPADTIDWLESRPWQGNVREVLSSLKRACLLGSGQELLISDLERKSVVNKEEQNWLGSKDLESAMKKFQANKVLLALKKSKGNRNDAAKLLGINPRTLFRHLETIREDAPERLRGLQ